jgi:cobalt-zinc-cadmium resistance protein CzcA
VIHRLVEWSIARRGLVVLLTLALAVVSATITVRLKLDALPDVTQNQVLVLTSAPGLTPEEIERRVSLPIELAVSGLPGLVERRSISRYGISSVTAVFEDKVDPNLARQMVSERISGVASSLPAGAGPPELGPLTGGLGEVFHFTLSSPSRTPAELLEIAQLKVAPLMRSVPGVVEVNTWGGERRSIQVTADPAKLAQQDLTLDDLRGALERATGSAAAGSVPLGSGQALLRAVSRPLTPTELGHAVVKRDGDHVLRVSDVADLGQRGMPRIGASTGNGRGEVVYLMAQMLRGDNALEVMERLKARLPEMKRALPDDVRLTVVYDRSKLVNATLSTVGKSLLEGGLLVIAVLFAMLGSLRAGLVVASVIPLSMLGAGVGMVSFDLAGNLMSLGAIDFGLVVDGAVVLVEQLFHAEHHDPPGPDDDRRKWMTGVASGVASPMLFSMLTILLVYAPIVLLTGVDGKMFRPMALTVVFALFASLVMSLTYVPAMSSLVLRSKDVPKKDTLLVRIITRVNEPLLRFVTNHPPLVAVAALGALALGGVLGARLGTEFTPQLDEGDLVVQTTRNADIRLETAVDRAGVFERAVGAVPEVTAVVSRIGSPAVATDIMGLEQADVFVTLKPRAEWRKGLSRDELIAEIERAIADHDPESEPSVTQPIQMRFNELLGGSVTDVSVSVYGDDLGELRKIAEDVHEALHGVRGAADARVLAPPDVTLVEVKPKPLEAAEAGLSVREVLDAVAALRSGVEVGTSYDGPLAVPIVLRVPGGASAFDLERVSLPTPKGGLVPLGRVASIDKLSAPSFVNHLEGQRRLMVGFNVRGADLGAVLDAAQKAIDAKVKVPKGYRLVWGGQYESLSEAKARLAIVIPVVLVLILLMLYAAFRRVKPVLVIFFNVPFACVGGILALTLRGMPVSMSAAVGFIALSGIAVLNGVVLLSRLIEAEERGSTAAEAALLAARARARPVIMTALVASLGFLPMMLSTGVGAEVQRPLATVVVGGLVTSTGLTLLIIPSLYPWFRMPRRLTRWLWTGRA